MSNRKYRFALGVLLIESFVTLGMLMSWLVSYFIESQLETDFGISHTALIWMRVLLGILFVIQAAMTTLLAKAISLKHRLWLQIWIIAQFVHFILTLITVILTTMGWISSFNIVNAVSLVYRLGILKFISDFREALPENNDITGFDKDKVTNPVPVPRKRASSSSSIRSASKVISHV